MLYRFRHPYQTGNRPEERVASIFGEFSAEAGSQFLSGTGTIKAEAGVARAALAEETVASKVFCFVAGTSVQVQDTASNDSLRFLSHGSQDASVSVPIEQVLPGDVVSSRNPQTGATEFKRVLRLVRKSSAELVTLTLADAQSGKVVEQIMAHTGA